MRYILSISVSVLFFVAASGASPGQAQDSAGGDSTDDATKFSSEELGQIVAQIALYPDAVVSQILMASTYPLEIVQADRWAKDNVGLDDTALEKALDEQSWDPSVKSLVNFPEVLEMMSEKLDWTTKLGDAFIAQEADVLAAIQSLRSKANDAGNLQSSDQQTVVVDASTQTIVIESSSPDIVYVPRYDPVVVYGVWPYPSYQPYYYRPPGYVSSAVVGFGVGVAVGAAWGYAWGNTNWGGGDIDIDINRNVNRNTNIRNTREFRAGGGSGTWRHDSAHRRGVSYRDRGTSERFGRGGSRDATQARENFRGRAERDRQTLSRDAGGRAGQNRTAGGARDSAGRAGQNRTAGASRGSAGRTTSGNRQNRAGSGANRSGARTSAFNNSGGSSSARRSSSRGSSSRSGARSRSGGSRGGGRRGR